MGGGGGPPCPEQVAQGPPGAVPGVRELRVIATFTASLTLRRTRWATEPRSMPRRARGESRKISKDSPALTSLLEPPLVAWRTSTCPSSTLIKVV